MGEGGSIILTGSSAGTTGAPAFGTYSASKAAVRNLARTWAAALKGTGIRIYVLSPGPTGTDLDKTAVGEEGIQAFASHRKSVVWGKRVSVSVDPVGRSSDQKK